MYLLKPRRMMMKRILCFILSLMCITLCVISVNASDSDSVSGNGFTVNGNIYDSYIDGSVTGQLSSGSTVQITSWYYNSSGSSVYLGTYSGSSYKRVSKPSGAYKMQKGYVKGTVSDGGVQNNKDADQLNNRRYISSAYD